MKSDLELRKLIHLCDVNSSLAVPFDAVLNKKSLFSVLMFILHTRDATMQNYLEFA